MKQLAPTAAQTFDDFIISRKAKGLSDKTLQTYHYHFSAIGKYLDTEKEIDLLSKRDIEQMLAAMRNSGIVIFFFYAWSALLLVRFKSIKNQAQSQ